MRLFYSPDYVASATRFHTAKKAAWVVASLEAEPIPGIELVAPAPVTVEDLRRVHDTDYIQAVETGHPVRLANSNGFEWNDGLWTAVCASTGGTVQAGLTALRTGQPSGSLSSGLHHARRAHGALYCTFNGLALAADAAIRKGAERVLILDLDAHCGGGTHELTRNQSAIVHLDISVSSVDAYQPVARDRLVLVHNHDEYLSTIDHELTALSGTFDLVIYNAGMDPYDSGISSQVLAEREAMVFDWATRHGAPIAFVLAGGYSPQEQVVALHRLTLGVAAATTGLELARA